MIKYMRFRFWFETVMALITGNLFIITVIRPHWIEGVFGVTLDRGDGSLEWLVVSVLLVTTVTLFVMACSEWRSTSLSRRSNPLP